MGVHKVGAKKKKVNEDRGITASLMKHHRCLIPIPRILPTEEGSGTRHAGEAGTYLTSDFSFNLGKAENEILL